jgi:hypothetical protein
MDLQLKTTRTKKEKRENHIKIQTLFITIDRNLLTCNIKLLKCMFKAPHFKIFKEYIKNSKNQQERYLCNENGVKLQVWMFHYKGYRFLFISKASLQSQATPKP